MRSNKGFFPWDTFLNGVISAKDRPVGLRVLLKRGLNHCM